MSTVFLFNNKNMSKDPKIIEGQKKIGANIRRARVARKITQQSLAEAANLNIRTVQKIEAGNINILVTTAIRIQKAINCPVEEIFKI